MVLGVGVDICLISRMEKLIEDCRFKDRVFTESERSYALSKPCPARHFASSFAAREAFSKASGLPLLKIVFQKVSVMRTDSGPVLAFQGSSGLLPPFLRDSKFHLSLSHDGDYAVAVVVIEGACHEI